MLVITTQPIDLQTEVMFSKPVLAKVPSGWLCGGKYYKIKDYEGVCLVPHGLFLVTLALPCLKCFYLLISNFLAKNDFELTCPDN